MRYGYLTTKKVYVGQTGRSLSERMHEHQRAVKSENENSGLFKHKKVTGHKPDFTKVSIVYQEISKIKRVQLESVTIAANKDRLLNLAPPNLHMLKWWETLRDVFPDCV